MKKIYLSFVLALIATVVLGQNETVKIVFDVSSSDIKVHESAVRHVKSMAEAYPDADFEMVIYSGALPMMVEGQSTLGTEVEKLSKFSNVTLKVCAQALKHHNLTAQDLISGVSTVPDGIIELVDKQNQGWGYIKEAN